MPFIVLGENLLTIDHSCYSLVILRVSLGVLFHFPAASPLYRLILTRFYLWRLYFGSLGRGMSSNKMALGFRNDAQSLE